VQLTGGGTVYSNQPAVFTATVTNSGNAPAENVQVAVRWPQEAQLRRLGEPQMRTQSQQAQNQQAQNQQNRQCGQASAQGQQNREQIGNAESPQGVAQQYPGNEQIAQNLAALELDSQNQQGNENQQNRTARNQQR